jgi:hypothetical protein
MKNLSQRAVPTPLLESPMAGLVGRIPLPRQITPTSAAAKNPQNPVQDVARIAPWAPLPIAAPLRLVDPRRYKRPLLFGQPHAQSPSWGEVLEDCEGFAYEPRDSSKRCFALLRYLLVLEWS